MSGSEVQQTIKSKNEHQMRLVISARGMFSWYNKRSRNLKCQRIIFLLTIALLSTLCFFVEHQTAFADFDCNTVLEIPISEFEALVTLYNSTDGESWSNNDNWLMSSTPCGWYGIDCFGGHVDELQPNHSGFQSTHWEHPR